MESPRALRYIFWMICVCLTIMNHGLSQVVTDFLWVLLESTRGELKELIELATLGLWSHMFASSESIAALLGYIR